MCRLLHLADVHLDAPFGGFGRDAESRAAEVLEAFRRLPDVAREHEVDAMLIAGDLFDRPRPADAVVIAVRETVRRLVEAGVPVFAVPGNHDAVALHPDLYERALEGATVFRAPRMGPPVTLDLDSGPVRIHGFAYDAAEEPAPLATFRKPAGEGLDVVLAHGSTPGAPHWEAGSALRIEWDALAGLGADYVALGDLHRFRGPAELRGAPACYPGSFAAVDLTESGTRGPVLVQLEPGAPPRIRRLSSGVREVGERIVVDVTTCGSDDDVAERVAERAGSAYPVVTLEGEPGFPLDLERVAATLEERFGAAALDDRSRFFDGARLEEIARRNTIAGHVARLGLETLAGATDETRDEVEQGLRIALRVMEVS